MVSSTFSALSLLPFGTTIIEPVIGAKVAAGLAAGVLGDLTDGGQKRDFADFANRDFNRRDAASDAQFQSVFAECTITMNGLAAVCITEIDIYNAQPSIAGLEATQGMVTILNNTAIHISSTITEYIEKLAKPNQMSRPWNLRPIGLGVWIVAISFG